MRLLITFLIIIFIPFFSVAEDFFPQEFYSAPRQWKKIEFLSNNKIEFISELDAGYTSGSFVDSYKGTYSIIKKEPFVYLEVSTSDNKEFIYVIHWTHDVLILTDMETKEVLVCTGSQYHKFPVDLEPQIRSFYEYSSSSSLMESYGGNTYDYIAENLGNYELTKPWVEGVDGSGVGEKIQFYIYDRVRSIAIINGYFDPQRPDLYYANNR
ncbi:MAG: hypothetical protein JEY91_19465, partial [Spirochaetaceae bacterium]|nr:hypothetical protein [Spirochaetaceae bacterium]